MIYLIHFEKPFHHAKHYLGFVEEGGLDKRLERHKHGGGSKLLKALKKAGIGWQLVRTWPGGTRTEERKFKNNSHIPRLCPICKAQHKSSLQAIASQNNEILPDVCIINHLDKKVV